MYRYCWQGLIGKSRNGSLAGWIYWAAVWEVVCIVAVGRAPRGYDGLLGHKAPGFSVLFDVFVFLARRPPFSYQLSSVFPPIIRFFPTIHPPFFPPVILLFSYQLSSFFSLYILFFLLNNLSFSHQPISLFPHQLSSFFSHQPFSFFPHHQLAKVPLLLRVGELPRSFPSPASLSSSSFIRL